MKSELDKNDLLIHLLTIDECHLYTIKVDSGVNGYYCKSWNLSQPLWTGKVKIFSKNDVIFVQFVDQKSDNIFAESEHLDLSKIKDTEIVKYIEPAVDSSRYFVIKIIDMASKRSTYVGFGFANRSDSFDFNEAIQHQHRLVTRQRSLMSTNTQNEQKLDKDKKLRQDFSEKLDKNENEDDFGDFEEAGTI